MAGIIATLEKPEAALSIAMIASQVLVSYETFVEKYRPIATGIVEGEPSRPMFAAYGKDLQTVRSTDEGRVWTIIDVDLSSGEPHPYIGEDGDTCLVIVAGYHYVNRLGYVITEVPWESADMYRLAYVVNERRVLRYDNEGGKGDHRH